MLHIQFGKKMNLEVLGDIFLALALIVGAVVFIKVNVSYQPDKQNIPDETSDD